MDVKGWLEAQKRWYETAKPDEEKTKYIIELDEYVKHLEETAHLKDCVKEMYEGAYQMYMTLYNNVLEDLAKIKNTTSEELHKNYALNSQKALSIIEKYKIIENMCKTSTNDLELVKEIK